MFCHGQPLQVSELVTASADEGFAVVNLVALAGSAIAAGGRARIGPYELGADCWGAWCRLSRQHDCCNYNRRPKSQRFAFGGYKRQTSSMIPSANDSGVGDFIVPLSFAA